MNIDILWINETEHRGITNHELLELANNMGRIVLTRDRDFTEQHVIRKSNYGIIYIEEPITKRNVSRIAQTLEYY